MLSGSITLGTSLAYTPATIPDLSSPADRLALAVELAFTDGSGAGQANRLWHDRRTVAQSTNDDIDLAGVLADVYGTTITLARVKALIIQHVSGTNPLTIGVSPTNPWISWVAASGDGVVLRPSGLLVLATNEATGYTVTAGSADVLRVANGAGTSVDYKITVVGATA